MKKILLIIAVFLFVLVGLAVLASLLFSSLLSGGTGFSLFANTIAIIPIKGEILGMQESGFSVIASADEIVGMLEDAEKDPSVAAIVLDIDSGGGSVVATKQIVAKVEASSKPVIAWIGDTGASGAYYIAASAKEVFADSDSITGSIGVLWLLPNYEELLKKIGVKMTVLKEGKNKTIASPFEGLTEEQNAILQQLLSDSFEDFKQRIQELRESRLNAEKFEAVTDGRILSGKQAKEIGLVDALGTKEDAVKRAAELAGVQGEPTKKNFGAEEFAFSNLFAQAGTAFGAGFKRGITAFESGLKAQ